LLNTNGIVKIADFGVSGTMESTVDCMTSWVGTVTYMSPERIKGESYYSDTDLWSMGLLMVECVTGRFPYPDPEDKVQELGFWELMQYITIKPSPVLDPKLGFSAELSDFISVTLRKSGGTRGSAAELLLHPFI
jgi:mitogen-activated protein kinase kinase 1